MAELEKTHLAGRTFGARMGDWIAAVSGSAGFVLFNFVWYLVWIVVNTGRMPVHAFDPYPYTFLTLVVSLEAIFLSIFVLMAQNRMSKIADLRNHIDLQINMLAEEEQTLTLQLLAKICDKLEIDYDKSKVEAYTGQPEVAELAEALEEALPTQ